MQRTITANLSNSSTGSLPTTLASKLHRTAPRTTTPYLLYGVSQSLFATCSSQANYTIPSSQRPSILTGSGPPKTASGEDLGIPDPTSSFWHTTLALPPTFSTWSQVTYLHMYLLLVRLRALPDRTTVTKYQQYLLDHFSHAAEDKMVLLHSMSARGVRNRYLKDLFLQWRGVVTAYDEGLVKGDAMLGAAVWRNLFKGVEEVEWERVALVVGFMRRAVRGLAGVAEGQIQFVVGGEEGVFERAKKGGVEKRVGREGGGGRKVVG